MEKFKLQYEYILNELSPGFSDFNYLETKSILDENNIKVRYVVYLEINRRHDEKYLHILFHNNSNIEATSNFIKKELSNQLKAMKSFIYIKREKDYRAIKKACRRNS